MGQQAQKAQLKKSFLEALEKSLGVITDACRKSKIPRRTVYNWIRDDPEFSASVRDVESIALDFAESSLFKQIKDGNTTATIFYLKTKGKARGYIERSEYAVDVSNLTEDQVDAMLNRAIKSLQSGE